MSPIMTSYTLTRMIMKNLQLMILAATAWLVLPVTASSQEKKDRPEPARGIIYGEVAGFLFLGNGSINYEYLLGEHFSLRGGIGGGYMIEIAEDFHTSSGGVAMVNFFTEGEDKFELGLGITYSFPKHSPLYEINPAPAFSMGYRYQTPWPGHFFRVGFTYHSRYGTPIQFSWGRTL